MTGYSDLFWVAGPLTGFVNGEYIVIIPSHSSEQYSWHEGKEAK
jgi:hypothetical protein